MVQGARTQRCWDPTFLVDDGSCSRVAGIFSREGEECLFPDAKMKKKRGGILV